MRCSEPGGGVAVAIVASRAPGRRAWGRYAAISRCFQAMNTDGLNRTMIAGFWSIACQSAQSHAMSMSHLCSQPFRELILQETQKLISQTPPTTDAELQNLNAQNMQLSAKISSISHASSMARLTPEVATDIYDATRAFCDDYALTSDCSVAGISLLNQIATLCHTATMKRVTER